MLNNAIQMSFYDPVSLAEIGKKLDDLEKNVSQDLSNQNPTSRRSRQVSIS
jgi:hypothetical protein